MAATRDNSHPLLLGLRLVELHEREWEMLLRAVEAAENSKGAAKKGGGNGKKRNARAIAPEDLRELAGVRKEVRRQLVRTEAALSKNRCCKVAEFTISTYFGREGDRVWVGLRDGRPVTATTSDEGRVTSAMRDMYGTFGGSARLVAYDRDARVTKVILAKVRG